jgi:hypothetical protein
MAQRPQLVILAAGCGSRFGGLKQLEPVGPGGGAILDYTVYDAVRAGFGEVVLVVGDDSAGPVREAAARRFGRYLPVRLARQRLDGLPGGGGVPAGRKKPWGTGHAVLAARDLVDRPFAVVNADDFYGAGALESLGRFLAEEAHPGGVEYAMVGYALGDTLPDDGRPVSRALCRTTVDGWLERIEEVPAIVRKGEGGQYEDEGGHPVSVGLDQPVSMNIFGFTPRIMGQLATAFERFLGGTSDPAAGEFYLSDEVDRLIAAGGARMRVLGGAGRWCGITNPGDQALVAERLDRLTDEGLYPRELWP